MLARLRGLVGWPRGSRRPERLLFAPQDLRLPNVGTADDLSAGLARFGDRAVRIGPGRSPFDVSPPSEAWAETLTGFGWLRDLRAADTRESRVAARSLVDGALRSGRRALDRGIGRRPVVVQRRLVAILSHSPFLLAGADHAFYTRTLRRVGRDAARLDRAARTAPAARDRLAGALGFCFATLATAGLEGATRRATRTLLTELDRQLVASDGAVARDPGAVLDLLLDLLPLRLLFASRSLPVPPAFDRAVGRAFGLLAALRHPSGELALFNGTGACSAGELALVFAQEGGHEAERPPEALPGYARLEAGGSLVLVDTGAPPPLAASAGFCAAPLAFEFSRGLDRVVVNAGAPPFPGPSREASRHTAAHSTLVLGGASAGHPLGDPAGLAGSRGARFLVDRLGPVLLGGARMVAADLRVEDGASVLDARHDGYLPAFGALHARSLRLSADGRELEGEDRLTFPGANAAPDADAVLHFHLHPTVVARTDEGGPGIVLDLPGGERWRFGAEGARPRLEPGTFLATSDGSRATGQIVVDLPPAAPGAPRVQRWLFIRE